ncbi:BatD family protein [Sulfuriflexus mobilis]|uniref:BatD family protein n=1 Tax=Sulfuriflexus mobilis TaxID=1811807 RepID=UPI000F81D037|nr:BatD family protein [Sulfuriflexus mobilis]
MVRRWLFILICQLPTVCMAAPGLELLIDKTQVQLGHALEARLHGKGIAQNLSTLDLSPLSEQFGVIVREYSHDKENRDSQQQLLLELYPRAVGQFTLPVLSLATFTTTPASIEVTPAMIQGKPLELQYHVSNPSPWQRQQVQITASLRSPDKFSRLELDDIRIPGLDVFPLTQTKTQQAGHSLLKTGWLLYPLNSGERRLHLPAILYRSQGVVKRRFYLPEIPLRVKPLPEYIPPLMPVGKVDIESSLDADLLLTTDSMYFWNIHLGSQVLRASSLPAVLRQITTNGHVSFHRVETQRRDHATADQIYAEALHKVPFSVKRSGRLPLPVIRIQYFDPESGKIHTLEHQPPARWVLAWYWQVLLFTIALYALYRLGSFSFSRLAAFRRRRQQFQQAITQLELSENCQQIRQTLKRIAEVEGWPGNSSLLAWAGYWNRRYQPSCMASINKLSEACYARRPLADCMEARDALVEVLRRKKPIS